jgi:hypothetical protein
MNEFYNELEALNDLGNGTLRNQEIPETPKYEGDESFSDAFSDAIRSFIDSIKNLFGVESETKEFDETLTEKASKALAEVFDEQTINEWGSMSMEDRQAKLSDYYAKLGETLGIDAKGVVVEDCYATAGEGVEGYNSGDGYLHIDYRNLQDPAQLIEVLNTTTHEARHQLQSEAIEDPSRFPEISPSLISEWEHNMQNYDSGAFGYESYYNQGVEVDARAFAGDVLNGYKEILGL